jgi:hypothetical protein
MKSRDLARTALTLCTSVVLASVIVIAPRGAAAAEKTYRHPIGLSFQHTADWQVGPSGSFTALVPPDLGADANGPTEAYLFEVQAVAPEITRADDPRVVQVLDEQMAAALPFAKRTGEPEAQETAIGPGAVLTWEGNTEDGVAIRARMFAVVSGRLLFNLVALGHRQQVVGREATLRAIFASFSPAEGQRDPALVGAWRNEKTESLVSGNFTAALLRRIELQFLPDGAGLSTETTRAVGDPGDTGEQTDTVRFTWFASGGTLCFIGEDGGVTQMEYQVREGEGGGSLVVSAGERPMVLARIQ